MRILINACLKRLEDRMRSINVFLMIVTESAFYFILLYIFLKNEENFNEY